MSFADSHAQIKKWTDKNVLLNTNQPRFNPDPGSGDLAWIQARCTYKSN
jgi:hypothetical protein